MVWSLRVIGVSTLAVVLAQATEGPADVASSIFWAFLLTLGALVAAGIGFPIPEELPIVGAGIWVGHNPELGPLRWLIWPLCIVGVVTSDGLLYGMGRFFGPRLLENRWMKRLVPPEKLDKIQENFHRYGVWTLLFARFLPAIRSPIFVTAGIMRLSLTRFLVADGIYAIPGVSGLFFLSWWFGDQFQALVERAETKVHKVRPLIILLVIAAVGGFLLYHFLRKPVTTGDPGEIPLIGDKVAARMESSLNISLSPAPKKAEADHHAEAKPPVAADETASQRPGR